MIVVHTQEGKEKHIYDVHHSPKFTQNLLSVRQMMQKGYRLVFDDDHYEVISKRTKQTVAVVKMSLYNFSLSIWRHCINLHRRMKLLMSHYSKIDN